MVNMVKVIITLLPFQPPDFLSGPDKPSLPLEADERAVCLLQTQLVPRLIIIPVSVGGANFWVLALPLKGVKEIRNKVRVASLITRPFSQASQKLGLLLTNLDLLGRILRSDLMQPRFRIWEILFTPLKCFLLFLKRPLKLNQLALTTGA